MNDLNKVNQVTVEGDMWAGLATSGTIPERYLARGIDNLGKAAFITRGTTKFLSMMTSRFPKAKTVNTREFKSHQISELDRVLLATATQQTTATDTITLSQQHMIQLQENDVIYNRDVYVNIDSSGTVSFSRKFGLGTDGKYYIDNEPMLVTGTNSSNNTVTVRRVARGLGRGDFGGALAAVPTIITGDGLILTGDHFLRGLPSFPEGGDAPRGFYAMPEMDNNFTQEFKYAVEITKESTIEKTYLGDTQMAIYKLLKMRQANLDIERTLLNGQKGKMMDRLGRVQYMTGGVFEYIMRDEDHIIDYSAITGLSSPNKLSYEGFLDVANIIAANGGSTTRQMFCGITLYTALKKAWAGLDILRIDEKASADFDIPIESIIGAGLSMNVVPLYSMEELGWSNKALVLDFSVPSFAPVSHPDWDMKIETDIQEKGQQIYKEQWIGIKGLERKYAQYQHIIDFGGVVQPGNII